MATHFPGSHTFAYRILEIIHAAAKPMTCAEVLSALRPANRYRPKVEKDFAGLCANGFLVPEADAYVLSVAASERMTAKALLIEDQDEVEQLPIVASRYIPPFKPLQMSHFRKESPRGEPIVSRRFLTTNTAINPEYKGAL